MQSQLQELSGTVLEETEATKRATEAAQKAEQGKRKAEEGTKKAEIALAALQKQLSEVDSKLEQALAKSQVCSKHAQASDLEIMESRDNGPDKHRGQTSYMAAITRCKGQYLFFSLTCLYV